jgi:hypothetical protein
VSREKDLEERLLCAINWLTEIVDSETDVHDDDDKKRLRRHIKEMRTTLEGSGDHPLRYVYFTLKRIADTDGKETSLLEVNRSINIVHELRRMPLPEVDYCPDCGTHLLTCTCEEEGGE